MSAAGLDELVEVLPEKDDEGRFFWQPFVERIEERLAGLPAPDGGESFVGECLAAGCRAVPVARRNGLWERQAPPSSDRRARGIYELRIRLGLFFAGSLRYLVHGLSRLRIDTEDGAWRPLKGRAKAGAVEWNPIAGGGASYREFVGGLENGEAALRWSDTEPRPSEVCLLSIFFLPEEERALLSLGVTVEVLDYVQPGRPRGLFGRMLAADGQEKEEPVDVAGVFLEGLVQAVEERVLRVNTRVNGHVFVTPDFWLVTSPAGVGDLLEFLRTRRGAARYDWPRHEVFSALYSAGYLAGGGGMDRGKAVRVYEVDVEGWIRPLELFGVAISSAWLPAARKRVPPFEGTVVFKKEIGGGNDEG